jgi:hypothetical protein
MIENSEPTAKMSLITNNSGLLCKEISIDSNGSIAKAANGVLFDGQVETIEVSLPDLKLLFTNGLSSSQALCNGTRKQEYSEISNITVKSQVVLGQSIARTTDFFEHSKLPAFLVLDCDVKDFTILENHSNLVKMMPEFKDIGMLFVSSSSSGIYKTDEQPPEDRKSSCHIYIILERGTCIPAIGKLIEYRAWTHGFGYIKLSSTGAMLKRHLFDDAVYSPERLIYEAPPILGEGVSQLPREIVHVQGGMFQC